MLRVFGVRTSTDRTSNGKSSVLISGSTGSDSGTSHSSSSVKWRESGASGGISCTSRGVLPEGSEDTSTARYGRRQRRLCGQAPLEPASLHVAPAPAPPHEVEERLDLEETERLPVREVLQHPVYDQPGEIQPSRIAP